jgi:hypothetical protein
VPTAHVGVERQVPMEYGFGMTGNTVTQRIEWGTIAGGQQRLNATGQVPPLIGLGRETDNTVSWYAQCVCTEMPSSNQVYIADL